VLNNGHSGAYGGLLSRLVKTQKKLCVEYFWHIIFKYCIEVVKKCHHCRVFTRKMHVHPAPLFPVITIGPFTKWEVDFTTCHSSLAKGNKYIIMTTDYFTKWEKSMPTFSNGCETTNLFIFNQVIARFGASKEIVIDHGSEFQNKMMSKLDEKLRIKQRHLSPCYSQANG
jgi:hypothetical protein